MKLLICVILLYIGIQDTTRVDSTVVSKARFKAVNTKLDSALIKLNKLLKAKKDSTNGK